MIFKGFLPFFLAHKLIAAGAIVLVGAGGTVATLQFTNNSTDSNTGSSESTEQSKSGDGTTTQQNSDTTSNSSDSQQGSQDTPTTQKKTQTSGGTNNSTQTSSGGSTGTSSGGTSGGSTGGNGGTGGGITNTPPTAPTSAHVGVLQSNLVRIDATRATDSDGIQKHELLRNGTVVNSSTSTSATVAISDNTVVAGQTYTYTMRAIDNLGAVGAVSNSVVVTVPTPDTTPPSVPTNFRLTNNSPGSITLAWDESTDNSTPQNDIWYILTAPLDESDFYTWTTTNPYTTSFFDAGVSYQLYIQAVDLAGNESAKAGPVTFTAQ